MNEIKRGPGRPKAEKTVTVKLHKGYWPIGRSEDMDKGKAKAGSVIELPSDEAKRVCHELKLGELFDKAWLDED